MTAAMTDSERALWIAAKHDYEHALLCAIDTWHAAGLTPDNVSLQAATATLLIHVTKLRSEERIHVRVPQSPAPAAVKREGSQTSQAAVAVPPCKKCGGATKDVRNEKRTDKSPDFVCAQEKGDCGKPSKDKSKWFPTGAWIDKPAANGGNVRPNPLVGQTAAESFGDKPAMLQDETDDLPF